ncbi:MAG: hypothetical protein PVF58_07065 [Candidatus Methanofastidiosia archaeon]|jgi:hypothetical protein
MKFESSRPLWNKHVLYDRILLGIVHLVNINKKYFEEGIESPSFEHHLKKVSFDLPEVQGEGLYELTVETEPGYMSPAIKVHQWRTKDTPTVVYHHGANEHPFDKTFNNIFSPEYLVDANLLVIRSPFHQKSEMELWNAAIDLSKYMALMAVSVKITEGVLSEWVKSPEHTVVAGYSLGGFITNRHHVVYDSAGAYVPFMAGTAHAEIFLDTWKAAPEAVKNAQVLRNHLNFDREWAGKAHGNVFPVLGRYDILNLLEVQGPSYGDVPVEVWDIGHLSGIKEYQKMREKILCHLPGLEKN